MQPLGMSCRHMKFSAETIMYPPSLSLASTNGPSATPDVVTTRPSAASSRTSLASLGALC